MTPTPPRPKPDLPRNARVRALAGGRVLVVTPDQPPRIFEADGKVSVIQIVPDAPPQEFFVDRCVYIGPGDDG